MSRFKAIGGLYISSRNPRVQVAPQQHGGEHEREMRSDTLSTPLILGFGKVVAIALLEQNSHLTQLRQKLWEKLSTLEGIHLNEHPTQRLPGNLNISVEKVDGFALVLCVSL